MNTDIPATPQQAFSECIELILSRWSSLRLVADYNPPAYAQHITNPFSKITSDIHAILLDYFVTHGVNVSGDELAENLHEYFSVDLKTDLDDDSETRVSEALINAYSEIVVKKNPSLLLRLRETAEIANVRAQEVASAAEGAEDDYYCEENSTQKVGMDVDHDVELGERYEKPVIDEDGFELVQKKNGRRK
ncbi:hypothetical protein HK096_004948 [Nowakowskiella sp. JEL0078]|nr:hypothetical protein HK096_004948 [Nowakowskiella sp. JEL0078]